MLNQSHFHPLSKLFGILLSKFHPLSRFLEFIHCAFLLKDLSATSVFPTVIHPLSNFPNSSIISTTQGSWPQLPRVHPFAHFPKFTGLLNFPMFIHSCSSLCLSSVPLLQVHLLSHFPKLIYWPTSQKEFEAILG